jgi:hypothetical protein
VTEYERFIQGKTREVRPLGFEVDRSALNQRAFDWQKLAVAWALRRGRAALVESCGLGKTIQFLLWSEQIVKRERKPVLVLCPIGVRQQTVREAIKFGIPVDFRETIIEMHAMMHPAWTDEELCFHPHDAICFCEAIRCRFQCGGLRDDLILRTLVNWRKSRRAQFEEEDAP